MTRQQFRENLPLWPNSPKAHDPCERVIVWCGRIVFFALLSMFVAAVVYGWLENPAV